MSVDRPTFSELWFRVASIRARLRTVVQVSRQDFRGDLWYVIQDDTSNQYYRLSRPAYEFMARLDGERTVSDVWMSCCDEQGDEVVTQPEVIQLLGNLYSANLLQADIPADAVGLFARYQSRKRRELTGMLANALFMQIPLVDPNVFLNKTLWLFGRLFTWYGAIGWLAAVLAGLYVAIGRVSELWDTSSAVLDPANLPILYLSFVAIKVIHELGHAVACKKFGVDEGKGGEVHAMGIMLMITMPVPYVDASSAWALRNKWHRIVVGAAGMIVELVVASACAIAWSRTAPGTAIHAITYNAMFIASVSTLLFNGNPLLRYDAYYMLSDFLEIPNLSTAGRDLVFHLIRKYVWGLSNEKSPVTSGTERAWLIVFFIASTLFRMSVAFGLFWVLANRWFAVGMLLAFSFVATYTVQPLFELARYLSSSGEIATVRLRATLTSVIALVALCGAPLAIVTPEYTRLEGIAEPRDITEIHAKTSEFLTAHLESGEPAVPGGAPLVQGTNEALDADLERFEWALDALVARKRAAQEESDNALVQVIEEKTSAMNEKSAELKRTMGDLTMHAPFRGSWVAPQIELSPGAYVSRGQQLGVVAGLDAIVIRAPADQQSAARILDQAQKRVEIRVRRRPDQFFTGTIEKIHPAGDKKLPSQALGYAAGGATETDASARDGETSKERTFQVIVRPDPGSNVKLLSGQRVVIRFELARTSLARQWWEALRRLVQRRLHT